MIPPSNLSRAGLEGGAPLADSIKLSRADPASLVSRSMAQVSQYPAISAPRSRRVVGRSEIAGIWRVSENWFAPGIAGHPPVRQGYCYSTHISDSTGNHRVPQPPAPTATPQPPSPDPPAARPAAGPDPQAAPARFTPQQEANSFHAQGSNHFFPRFPPKYPTQNRIGIINASSTPGPPNTPQPRREASPAQHGHGRSPGLQAGEFRPPSAASL